MATMTARCKLTTTIPATRHSARARSSSSSGGGVTRNGMRHRVSQQRATNRRGAFTVVVRAESSEDDAEGKSAANANEGPRVVRRRFTNGAEVDAAARLVVDRVQLVATRYDWLSAGVGASSCAMWFVIQGQSVSTALGIASVATIAAVVVEELLGDCERGW